MRGLTSKGTIARMLLASNAAMLLATIATMLLASNAAAQEKTGGEIMKNVHVLQDVPASEWDATMAFMGGALGVDCQYCHVPNAFEKDDRKPKQTARAMIEMTRELNRRAFAGRAEVTCYTCHQGNPRPKSIPNLWSKTPEQLTAAKKEPEAAPAASADSGEQVYAKYRQAVGGEARSIHMKGTFTLSSRPPFDAEFDLLPPDKLAAHVNAGGTQIQQIFDGVHGWLITPDRTAPMTETNVVSVKRMVEAMVAVKFPVPAAPRKAAPSEKVGDRVYTVLESQSPKALERLYFDPQSGLLFRRYVELRTPLGANPSEMTFEDYREVNGVKLPYLITIRAPNDRAQYKFAEIQTNVEIDPARFEAPRK